MATSLEQDWSGKTKGARNSTGSGFNLLLLSKWIYCEINSLERHGLLTGWFILVVRKRAYLPLSDLRKLSMRRQSAKGSSWGS